MLVKAIHTIHRSAKSKPSIVKPGELVELEGAELERVQEMGAVVKPTKAEIALSGIKPAKGKKAAAASESEQDDEIDLGDDGSQDA